MSREQRNALINARRVAEAVIAVVNDTPGGAPGELLYAPLASYLSREDFEMMMRALVAAKRITRKGERYYPASAD
jgi:hypothetical protein